jgi:hypothetical protein
MAAAGKGRAPGKQPKDTSQRGAELVNYRHSSVFHGLWF